MNFLELLTYFTAALVVEDALFSRSYALDNLFGIYKNRRDTVLFCSLLAGMLLLSNLLTWALHLWLYRIPELEPWLVRVDKPLLPVLAITIVYLFALLVNRLVGRPAFYNRVKALLPMAAFNCTVLGTILLSGDRQYTLPRMLAYSLGMVASFVVSTLIVRTIRRLVANVNVPHSFRGLPMELLVVGIIGLGLSVFSLA